MTLILDPRVGDVEDDASSPYRRSLVAIAGSLLAEISLPKLLLAWLLLIGLPGILLGLAPILLSAWLQAMAGRGVAISGYYVLVLPAAALLVAWLGGRTVWRAAESSFWSLNALLVQPGYALLRESLRHLVDILLPPGASRALRAKLHGGAATMAGLLLGGLALWCVALAWPASRWLGNLADLAHPLQLIGPAFANAVVVLGLYLAAAALFWGMADGAMDQPHDLPGFEEAPAGARVWRVAHLSDLHVVGERYGFRIESGRAGPRGNDRCRRLLAQLAAIHDERPLDIVLITGDMTDAGRASEWAEFLAMIGRHPALFERTLILPGNHDVNVVDRANPARLDLPLSPGKRLRQLRALSAMAAVQGDRVHTVDLERRRLGDRLDRVLAPHAPAIRRFADDGGVWLSRPLERLWFDVLPMVMPPAAADGLGVILLNSNSETHFSFTNALGLVTVEETRRLLAVLESHPDARWLIALHHHLIEYPMPAKAFSERIGTALINGSWFVRQLAAFGRRAVALHGHRHIDWFGECHGLRIVSAPSPVMNGADDRSTYFYIQQLAAAPEGRLALLAPERVIVPGGGDDLPSTAVTAVLPRAAAVTSQEKQHASGR